MFASSSTIGNGCLRAAAWSSSVNASCAPLASVGRMRQWASVSSSTRRLVSLSSTTSTRSPRTRAPSGRARCFGAAAVPKRTSKWKRLPRPGALSTWSRPPIAATRRAAIESPRPVPPNSRVVEGSTCSNASKIRCCLSCGMPMPVSATAKRSVASSGAPASASTSTSTSPRFVNLIALPTRLTITCLSARGVARHERRHAGRDARDELEALLVRAHPERAQRVAHQLPHFEWRRGQLELAGLDAREVEQVADQAEQRLGRLLERAHVLALHAAQRRVEQQLRHADHRVHRRADLVADVREEVALGAARRLGSLARRLQLLRGGLLLGHVAGHAVDEALLEDRRRVPGQPAVAAVAAAVAVLEPERALAGAHALGRAVRRRAVVRMNEVHVRPAHQLLDRVAERLLPRRVEAAEVAVEAGDAEKIARHVEERLELVLRAIALDELADLAADRGEQLEQVLVGLAYLAAEELEHSEHDAAELDRESERPVQAFARGDGGAREVRVADDVLDPGGLAAAPHAPRQPDGALERRGAAHGVELGHGDGRRMPGVEAADRGARAVHGPDRPVIEAQRLAERLQDARGRLGERRGLGERAGRLVLDVQAADRIGLAGSAHGVAVARVRRDVTPRLPAWRMIRGRLRTRINRMNARFRLPLALVLGAASTAVAQEPVDLAVVHRIKAEAFQNGKVMDHLFFLTDVGGPRLTASPGQRAAADWAIARLKSWGIDSARSEPWGRFGRSWQLKRFAAHQLTPTYAPLHGVPLAWSGGTRGPVTADVVLAPVFERFEDSLRADPARVAARVQEYAKQKRGKLAGRIVLIEPLRELPPATAAALSRFDDADLAKLAARARARAAAAARVAGHQAARRSQGAAAGALDASAGGGRGLLDAPDARVGPALDLPARGGRARGARERRVRTRRRRHAVRRAGRLLAGGLAGAAAGGGAGGRELRPHRPARAAAASGAARAGSRGRDAGGGPGRLRT